MSTIAKFTLVQVLDSQDGKPSVKPWAPAAFEQPGLVSAHKLLGVTMTDSEFEEQVAVMRRGYARGVSDGSETWAVGDVLWADSSGAATNTRPTAPLPLVLLGVVYADEGSGLWTVAVDVREIPSLGELSGVSAETPADKDVFIYKNSTHVWEPRQIDHGADIAGLLDDDHTQYLKEEASGGLASEIPDHTHADATQAGALDHGVANTAASLLDNDHPLYQRKHGFEVSSAGAALLTITYDAPNRKITLTPTGASFRFWVDGVQYVKSGAQVSGAHVASTGKHFFYYDASGVLQTSTTPWGILDRTISPVALVYYYTGISDGICFYECHTADRTLEQHLHDHLSEGTKFLSGGALSGYALATDTAPGVTFGIAATTIADEDINRTLAAVADNGPYMTMWRTGAAGDWTFNDTRTLPWEYDAGANYVAYNDPNAGGAGVWGLTSAGGGNFVVYFLCCSTVVQGGRQFFLIPAQAATGTLASALTTTVSSLAWGAVPFEELVPLYRIIYRTGASYGTSGRGRIEQIDSITNSVTATVPGSPSVHNSLSGRDAAGAHPATAVSFVPYSTIAATDVQAAIQELLDEGTGVASLDAIPDVNAPAPNDGDVLTWDSTPGEWVALPSSGGGALDDLTDVNAPTPSDGDVLAWDSTPGEWVNVPAGTPATHALTHEVGGGDDIFVELLATLETDTAKVLKPDGVGGVEWGTDVSGGGGGGATSKSFVCQQPPAGSTSFPYFEAEQNLTITKLRVYLIGSGSCLVNVAKNAADITSDLAAVAATWTSTGTLSVSVTAGDDISVEIKSVTGTVSYVAVQIDYTV